MIVLHRTKLIYILVPLLLLTVFINLLILVFNLLYEELGLELYKNSFNCKTFKSIVIHISSGLPSPSPAETNLGYESGGRQVSGCSNQQ